MENLKLLFHLYLRPAQSMSDIIDRGSWMFAAMLVLVISIVFFSTINAKLHETYRIPDISEYYNPETATYDSDSPAADAAYKQSMENYRVASESRSRFPIVGDTFFKFFSFDPGTFYFPILSIS